MAASCCSFRCPATRPRRSPTAGRCHRSAGPVTVALRPSDRSVVDRRLAPAGPHPPADGGPVPVVPGTDRAHRRGCPAAPASTSWSSRTASPAFVRGRGRPSHDPTGEGFTTGAGAWALRGHRLHQRPHRIVRRTGTGACASGRRIVAATGPPSVSAIPDVAAGVLLREPGCRDRCDDASSARPDLRLPVHGSAHRGACSPGSAHRAATSSPTCWRRGGRRSGSWHERPVHRVRAVRGAMAGRSYVYPNRVVRDLVELDDADRDAFAADLPRSAGRFDGLYRRAAALHLGAAPDADSERSAEALVARRAAVGASQRQQAEVPGRFGSGDGGIHQ